MAGKRGISAVLSGIFMVGIAAGVCGTTDPVQTYDIVVYGGTSAGVIAAAQAQKMGNSVVLIEPGQHLGGMTSSGLGWVDLKTPKAVGGLTRHFFHHVWQYYQRPSSWIWEAQRPINGQVHTSNNAMWILEPHVAEKIFNAMIGEVNVPVILGERLNRNGGVQLTSQRIVQVTMESGLTIAGTMFIDASYEGDLMAAANVSYIVGREANSLYQETFNGIHVGDPTAGVTLNIDCYQTKGDPQSGLLPRIYPGAGGNEGDGDKGVQGYNYRMCLTDVPQNRALVQQPAGYDESQYEIIFRAIEAGEDSDDFFKLDLLPNRKTDSNNSGNFSTDYVGANWNYPEADYATRDQMAQAHEQWQRGLVWTLQNHPRVPAAIQTYYAPWGLAKDEFTDNNNWPWLLYVREARRMVSPVVIDEATVEGMVPVSDSVGLSHYDMDSHDVKYFVDDTGLVDVDGGLYQKVINPFPISYQALLPARSECENLIVPVCLSASHTAYGAVRVEPTYMILGQSAATAASLAIKLNVALQDLPYAALSQQLLADGQILEWSQ